MAYVCFIALFVAVATGGWDNRFAAAALAVALLALLAGWTLTKSGRIQLAAGPIPRLAAGLMAGVIAYGALQLAPIWSGLAHPSWQSLGAGAAGSITIDRHATLIEIVKLCGMAAAFTCGLGLGRDRSGFRRALGAFVACGGAYAAWSVGVFVVAHVAGASQGRLFGGLGSANVAASVFVTVLLIAAGRFLFQLRSAAADELAPLAAVWRAARADRLASAAMALAGIALLLTASRAGVAIGLIAIVALIGAAAVTFPGATSPARRSAVALIGAAVLAAAGYAAFGGFLADRFETVAIEETSRAAVYEAHLPAIGDALATGHGYGTFLTVNNMYMTEGAFRHMIVFGSLHSVYLQWLEEGGIIGAGLMFGAAFLVLGGAALRGLRSGRSRALFLAGVIAALAVAGHTAIEYTLSVYAVACLYAVLVGAYWAFAHSPRGVVLRQQPAPEPQEDEGAFNPAPPRTLDERILQFPSSARAR